MILFVVFQKDVLHDEKEVVLEEDSDPLLSAPPSLLDIQTNVSKQSRRIKR